MASDFGDSEGLRFSSSSKLLDMLENVFDVLERFDFPLTAFSSSTDRSRLGAAQTLTGTTRRPRIEKSLKINFHTLGSFLSNGIFYFANIAMESWTNKFFL